MPSILSRGLKYGEYHKWYRKAQSSYYCSDADSVRVWLAAEIRGRNFQLDSGGSITGRLVDEDGEPLGGLTVEYDNDKVIASWYRAVSDPDDGAFSLYGIGPGRAGITIISDPGRYLAGFRKNFYLAQVEHKDIGTFTVRKGAGVRSMVTRDSVPLPDRDLAAGAKLFMSEVETDADGEFSFILPPGEFTIHDQDDLYAVAPRTVTITQGDVGGTIDIPPFPAYDVSNGDVYSGTVAINAGPPAGNAVMVLSFMNDQGFGLNTWGGLNPLSIGGPFTGAAQVNPYELAAPPGSTVRLMSVLYGRGPEDNESVTLIESRDGLSGGGGPYSFNYDNSGSTVGGHVTRNGEPVFYAMVAIYRATDNGFAGFARTDHTGHYVFYDVPDGTYRIEATAEDYDCLAEAPPIIVDQDLSVAAIELGECAGCKGDLDGDGDVDGADLAVFISNLTGHDCGSPNCAGDLDGNGQVDESDLTLLAANFGRVDCR